MHLVEKCLTNPFSYGALNRIKQKKKKKKEKKRKKMKIRVFSGNCLFSASEFQYLSNEQNLSDCDNGERDEN